MLKKIPAAIICTSLITVLSACNDQANAQSEAIKFDNQSSKVGYSIGMQMGSQIVKIKDEISEEALIMGIKDSLAGKQPQLPMDKMQAAMQEFQKTMMEKEKAKQLAKSSTNVAEGKKFLAENKSKDGVTTTKSGLQYKILKAGEGTSPSATDTVVTHYTGTLIDGKVFDSSYTRNSPATFPVNGVIKGWTEALQLMKVGSKWQLFIPSELAYGKRGAGADIGPDQVLIFEIELLEIKKS